MFFQVVISPKFIKDYFYCLTNQKCVQSFICILGECLLTRFSNILGFWIQDEAGDTDPWLLPLSQSPNLFCWLLWPLRPAQPGDRFLSLLFDLTPKIIYHGFTALKMFSLSPFAGICQYLERNNTKEFPEKRWCLEWLVTLGIKTYNLERNYYLCDSSPIYLFFLLFGHYGRKKIINGGYFSDWQNLLFINLSKV